MLSHPGGGVYGGTREFKGEGFVMGTTVSIVPVVPVRFAAKGDFRDAEQADRDVRLSLP